MIQHSCEWLQNSHPVFVHLSVAVVHMTVHVMTIFVSGLCFIVTIVRLNSGLLLMESVHGIMCVMPANSIARLRRLIHSNLQLLLQV